MAEVGVHALADHPRRVEVAADILVHAVILGLGVLAFALPRRSPDFFTGDTTYFELARSIVDTRSYGFDFRPETLLPPGLPAILALLCVTVGCGYVVLLRSMAVFAALGLMAAYELLKREQSRGVAAACCVLLASSPTLFRFATRTVMSDLPYLFTSLVALLAVTSLDRARRRGARIVLGLLCAVMLVTSVMIRSAGVALLAGLAAWLVVSCFTERAAASRRLKTFLPLLLIGVVVQGLWMHRAATREVLDWPLVGGYPHSYLAQLTVKSGNHPELGRASLGDVPARVARNLDDRAVWLMRVLTRKDYIQPGWFSPVVLGATVLTLLGVAGSIGWGRGPVLAWYFIAHEAMYLVWPWDFEERFVLPVAPLACLYLWRGGKALCDVVRRKPRMAAAVGVLISPPLGLWAGATALALGSLQASLATLFWALVAALSAGTLWRGWDRPPALWARWRWRLTGTAVLWGRGLPLTATITVVLGLLVGLGVAGDVGAGRENLRFDVTRQPSYPDVEAGQWIRAHTASTAVVMARQLDVVYHYGRRRVVWFPPLSDPDELMSGIRSHRVDFVVVVRRAWTYWSPPEADCFERLVAIYPDAFRAVHEDARFTIFQTVPALAEGRPGGGPGVDGRASRVAAAPPASACSTFTSSAAPQRSCPQPRASGWEVQQ